MILKQSRFLLLGAFISVGQVFAADINMNPGKWTWTSQMQMPGMSMQMPPMTYSECVTRENMVPTDRNLGQDCKAHDIKMESDRVSWHVTCKTPGGDSTGKGVMHYSGDTAKGEMTFTTQGMQMNLTMTGRRIGACK